jgi:hypothetical protein
VKTTEPKARKKAPRFANVAQFLYRESATGIYYGIKSIAGKQVWHSFGTTDRLTAKNLLKSWLESLASVDPSAASMTLEMLVRKFEATRGSMSDSTRTKEAGILKEFRSSFPRPMKHSGFAGEVLRHRDFPGRHPAREKGPHF